MKALLVAVWLAGAALCARGASTIDAANPYACGANFGWVDWRGDTANGAVIGEYVCSGCIYVANAGWLSLGGGAPANAMQYQNDSAADFGVNHDGQGNLRGLAYGANLGWVSFETNGAPKVDLVTGRLSGYAYSANAGWLSLSNAVAAVRTASIAPGADADGDGIADAWEYTWFASSRAADALSDSDHDGVADRQEYWAGTNPTDPTDKLVITQVSAQPGGLGAELTWKSVPTRHYYVEQRPSLDAGAPWLDSGLGLILPDGTNTTRTVTSPYATQRFYRVKAVRPLSP